MKGKKCWSMSVLAIMLTIIIGFSGCSMLADALGTVNLVISDSKKSGGSTKPPKGRADLTVKEEPEKPKEEAPKEQPAEEKKEEAVAEEPVQEKDVAKTEEAQDLSETTADEPTQKETAQEETAAASSETTLAEDSSETTEGTESEEAGSQKTEEEVPEIAKAEKEEKQKPEKPKDKPEKKPEKKPATPESKPKQEEESEEVPESAPEVQMFRPLFAQAFYFGGFYAGDDTFKESQGVTWRIEWKRKNERKTITLEKALLKINSDGTRWWYIRHASREGDYQYEVLTDRENLVTKIHFKDRNGRDSQYQFSGPEWTAPAPSEGGPAYRFKNENEYARYKEGNRTINIGAGKFKTDYLRVTYMDRGVDRVYQWWITDKVPGKLAKFIWEDKSEKSTTQGELMSVKMGYTTQFGSY